MGLTPTFLNFSKIFNHFIIIIEFLRKCNLPGFFRSRSFVFTEISVKFMKSIFGSEILLVE